MYQFSSENISPTHKIQNLNNKALNRLGNISSTLNPSPQQQENVQVIYSKDLPKKIEIYSNEPVKLSYLLENSPNTQKLLENDKMKETIKIEKISGNETNLESQFKNVKFSNIDINELNNPFAAFGFNGSIPNEDQSNNEMNQFNLKERIKRNQLNSENNNNNNYSISVTNLNVSPFQEFPQDPSMVSIKPKRVRKSNNLIPEHEHEKFVSEGMKHTRSNLTQDFHERRIEAERNARQWIDKNIFDPLESTALYKKLKKISKKSSKSSKKDKDYSEFNEPKTFGTVNNGWYQNSMYDRPFSRHEAFVESLVNKYIQFREIGEGNPERERQLALEIVGRVEKYTNGINRNRSRQQRNLMLNKQQHKSYVEETKLNSKSKSTKSTPMTSIKISTHNLELYPKKSIFGFPMEENKKKKRIQIAPEKIKVKELKKDHTEVNKLFLQSKM